MLSLPASVRVLALGVATKDLQLPIVRMVEAKKLKTTREWRGTRYFVR